MQTQASRAGKSSICETTANLTTTKIGKTRHALGNEPSHPSHKSKKLKRTGQIYLPPNKNLLLMNILHKNREQQNPTSMKNYQTTDTIGNYGLIKQTLNKSGKKSLLDLSMKPA